ncbi:MAG: phosphatase PAP2 family protein [Clostridiales bacterium]|nr:phosphatase PAP2 family protein [Clostridiales bacterium]
MAKRAWPSAAGFALCAGVFLLIALNLNDGALRAFDLSVTGALAAGRTSAATALLSAVTALCAPGTLLIICLGLLVALRQSHYGIPIAVNLMVSVWLNYALKSVFLRERPPEVFRAVREAGYSFPSGHAMAAGAFYGFLIVIVARSDLKKCVKRALITLLSAVIALICFSRVYLGVHYLSDVVAGLAVSIAYLIAFAWLVGLYLRAEQWETPASAARHKSRRMLDSLRHALDGVFAGFKNERNMVIHFAAMALVTVFGFLCGISEAEWLACVILFGLVIGMELMNTAVETTVDICMPKDDPRAKIAKDTAAGAVLLVSLAAAIAGAIIFLPKLWPMLG